MGPGSPTAVLKANAMRLAAHHGRTCDEATCTISLSGRLALLDWTQIPGQPENDASSGECSQEGGGPSGGWVRTREGGVTLRRGASPLDGSCCSAH